MKRKNCYIYTRVSTSMQVDGFSLDAQKEKLRRYAEFQDFMIAGEYSDEGKSGKNIEGRPEFQTMLNDISEGKDNVQYVLVFKLSRFGRNAADVLNSLQLMQDYGVNLICVEDGIDSSKDSGKLMISVLSAVAEIERENILVQTMEGRKQKAREGKWNGGFAPYGYELVDGELKIAEDEAEIIRIIYDKFIHTTMGAGTVAKYLNRQGYIKKKRQNGTLDAFTAHFVKLVLDNPIYCGKIAFGRRKTEKIQGSRNEYHVVKQEEYPIYDGIHDAIISEEDWLLAQDKRKKTGIKNEKIYSTEHQHLLTGIIKCPICGAGLYGSVNRKRKKDGSFYRDYWYYACKHRLEYDGHKCTFKKQIHQEKINEAVVEVIRNIVKNSKFDSAIKEKLDASVDLSKYEKEEAYLMTRIRQLTAAKERLGSQIDRLDCSDRHYEQKYTDMQNRINSLYDEIAEATENLETVQTQIKAIKEQKISQKRIFEFLELFDIIYNEFTEFEKKEFLHSFIKKIEIYPEPLENGQILKSIQFRFPVYYQGNEADMFIPNFENTVETVVCLSRENYAGGDETMLCDMHTHSNCSDGSFSPEELIEEAKKEGIAAIALCDHNTVSGLTRFINAAKESGVIAVPGVEITSAYKGKEVHILGLFLKERHYQKIANYLEQINIRKIESNKLLAKRLNEGGYVISYDAVLEIAGKAVPNRVHFAKALFAKGYVSSVAEAFDTILAEGGEFYKPAKKLDSLEVIRFLHDVDAVTVLAHPFLNFSKTELCEFLQKAKQYGLVGMETIYPLFSKEDSALAQEIAKEFALIASGGSDFHGINKPDIKLGRGKHNISVPYEVYENLRRSLL